MIIMKIKIIRKMKISNHKFIMLFGVNNGFLVVLKATKKSSNLRVKIRHG